MKTPKSADEERTKRVCRAGAGCPATMFLAALLFIAYASGLAAKSLRYSFTPDLGDPRPRTGEAKAGAALAKKDLGSS
jgi:hypothetical protein